MKKRIIARRIYTQILLSKLCLVAILTHAQNRQEFSIWAGGGASTLHYQLNQGYYQGGLGMSAGAGYMVFISRQWGIGTGVDYTFYNSKTSITQFSDNYLIPNPAYPGDYYFLTNQSDYAEKQKAGFIKIPLKVQFQGVNDDVKIYTSFGASIGIPVSGSYNGSIGTLKTSGYSTYTGNYYEDIPDYGYSTYHDINTSGSLDFKISYSLNAEAGIKWRWKGNLWGYMGIYAEYGLNDIRKKSTAHITGYQESYPSQFLFSSITNAQYTLNESSQELVSKVNLISLGVQAKISIGK